MSEFASTEVLAAASSTEQIKKTGIGMLRAAFLMATQVTGSGVLALPSAASDAGGWLGVGIMLLLCFNAVYTDMHLGRCWIIIEKHNPHLKGPLRNPYPTIGEYAFGNWARQFISITLQITLIGAGTVYLILASEILDRQFPVLDTCIWMLILAGVLCPVMWLGSFKDFWGFGVLGFVTIITASVIATVVSIMDLTAAETYPDTSVVLTVQSFFLGFGVIMFAFGGAGIFPTIQNDMSSRERFPLAVVLAFAAILGIYVPVTVSGFAAYGHDLESNIFGNLTPGLAVTIAELLIAADLMIIFILTTNPAMQYFEMILNIEPKFDWKRVTLRTASLLFMLFLGQSVRDFGKVLALVGGSTTVLLNLVVPATLYLKLCAKYEPEKPIEIWRRSYLYFVIALGLIGGSAATYSAFADIFAGESFRKPCYIP